MKKREFQTNAAGALFKKLADVCVKTGQRINVIVSSKYNNSFFKIREHNNLISVAVKQTGELSYSLTDELGNTDGDFIYYLYNEADDHEAVIKKFADDIGRLYKDFIRGGTLHGFCNIKLSYSTLAADALKEYENCIKAGCL